MTSRHAAMAGGFWSSLWPRGIRKDDLDADEWLKDVAPSTELRKWFGHRPERWTEFRRRYRQELSTNRSAWEPILEAGKRGNVTLLYSAHDVIHNGAGGAARLSVNESKPGGC